MVKNLRLIAGLLLGLTAVFLASRAAANEVAQWNETTMKVIEANGQNNVVSTRTLAMVQGAVHDALNAINRRYDAYYFEGPGDPAASPDAAVAAAAHTVLVGVVEQLRHARSEGRDARPGRAGLCRVDRPRHRRARPEQGRGGRPRGRRGDARASQGRRRHPGRALHAGHGAGQVAAASEPGSRQPAHRQSGRWLAATCPRRFRAGATSRRSPCSRPRSSGFPGRRR